MDETDDAAAFRAFAKQRRKGRAVWFRRYGGGLLFPVTVIGALLPMMAFGAVFGWIKLAGFLGLISHPWVVWIPIALILGGSFFLMARHTERD